MNCLLLLLLRALKRCFGKVFQVIISVLRTTSLGIALFLILCTRRFTKRRFHKTATLGKSYWQILSVLGTIYLNIAFLSNFCWWKVMHKDALRKELSYAPLVECFNTITLGKFQWWLLSILQTKCLSIAFLPNFCLQKVKHKPLYQRSWSLLLS